MHLPDLFQPDNIVNNWKVSLISTYILPYFPDIQILSTEDGNNRPVIIFSFYFRPHLIIIDKSPLPTCPYTNYE